MSSEDSNDSNDSNDANDPQRPTTWGQRHAITILTTVLFGLLALVTIIQVAC